MSHTNPMHALSWNGAALVAGLSRRPAWQRLQQSLFGNGEAGAYYPIHDLYTLGRLYQDTAGTTPADTVDDPVGRVDYLSGNGDNATQGTSTARPLLARQPVTGRRNLLTYTEDFGNAVWTKVQCTVTVNATTAPDGTLTADKLVETAEGGGHRTIQIAGTTGTGYYISVYAKAGERHLLMIERGYGGANGDVATFDLSNGTVVRAVPQTEPVSIEHVSDGWYRCSCYMPQATNSRRCGFVIGNPDNPTGSSPGAQSYEGDGVSGLYLWGAQISYDKVGPYQRVTTANDVTEAGVPTRYYAKFDKTDDALNITLDAFTGGTVVLVTTAGMWVDEGYDHAGGTITVGPASYTGGPAGLLSLETMNEILGIIVIDRAITESEKAQILGLFPDCPGEITLGDEIWDKDAQGVNNSGGSSGVWDAGTQTVSNSDTGTNVSYPRLVSVGLELGATYIIAGTFSGDVGSLNQVDAGADVSVRGQTSHRSAQTANYTTFELKLDATTGSFSVGVDLSIRKITFPGGA